MLGEQEGFFVDLTSHSSGRWGDGCGWTMRSGGGDDLSSDESEFLCKRNSKKGGVWIQRWIMRLPTPFLGRREERWYRGGETVNGEWSSLMLLFWGEERKGQCAFQKGKGACEATLISCTEGLSVDVVVRRRPTAGVRRHMD
jgi:hypothetical protein